MSFRRALITMVTRRTLEGFTRHQFQGPRKFCFNLRASASEQQAGFGPAGGLGDGVVCIGSHVFKHREKLLIAAVAHGDGGVAAQAAALGAADGRSAEGLAKFFF